MDGGTAAGDLVGPRGRRQAFCFDGRECEESTLALTTCRAPDHVFVGAHHPTLPGARSLPLWGSEERQLVKELVLSLENPIRVTDPRTLRIRSLDKRSKPKPRLAEPNEAEAVIQRIRDRYATHAAIDSGRLASMEVTLRYFDQRPPLRLQQVRHDSTAGWFEVVIVDSASRAYTFRLLTDHRSSVGSQVLFPRRPLLSGNGTSWDRATLTLVQAALESDGRADADRIALRNHITARVRQVLYDDQFR